MRIRAIDWMRGLVIMLMTVDHSGTIFDAAHLHGDNGRIWIKGSPLPAGEFLTRWITHLCAPTFILLAGASLALSSQKRRDEAGQTRFLITRGLLIAALDPLWMSLAFRNYEVIVFQVLYAIGMAMVCMAGLRKLSSRMLWVIALAIQLFGELSSRWEPTAEPVRLLWVALWSGGKLVGRGRCAYPLLPWLSIMILGYILGRWLVQPRSNAQRARVFALLGVGLLAVFAIVRGVNDYGNWGLYRDSGDFLQWLHVNKYPPSVSFTALELGLAFLVLAGFTALDDPGKPRRAFAVFGMFGATAFFYYLLHVHLMQLLQALLNLDVHTNGLAKTWLGATTALLILGGPCWLYLRYKRAHPNGWTRYI